MPSHVHLLSHPGDFTVSTVVCGARDAALGTWDPARVTCPACQRGVCTCGPQQPLCPTCRQWQAAHRGWTQPSRPPMKTEKQFQAAVQQRALANGFLFYHVWDARRSPPGFPDIVCVKGPLLVIAELKMPGKQPSAAQQKWLDALTQVRQVETRLWRPEDWPEIEEMVR